MAMDISHIPEIDEAEALFCVVGVRDIVSKTAQRITKSDLGEALRLPWTITRLARAVVNDELTGVEFSDFNYNATLQSLSEDYKPQHVEDMVARFAPADLDLAASFIGLAGNVFTYLQTKIPTSTYATISGDTQLQPNTYAVHSFMSLLEVLDDPLRVFPLMQQGGLLKAQVQIVRELYPSFAAAVDAALTTSILNEKTARASYELPPYAEMGVTRWFGNTAVTPAMQKALQASYKREDMKPPAPQTDRRTNAMAKEALSPAQETTFAKQLPQSR